MSGNIVIKPLTAKLTRSTEFFGKMDPLVKVLVGTHYQQTGIARKGHKNPGWETELTLRRSMEDIIHFEVWDKDILKGDLIGSGDLSFNKIFQMGNRVSGWIPLYYKGKEAGDLLVDVLFIPDAGVNVGQQQQQQQETNRSTYLEGTPRLGTVQEGVPRQIPNLGFKGLSEISEKSSITNTGGIGPVEAAILQGTRFDEKREFREGEIITRKYDVNQYSTDYTYKPIFQNQVREVLEFDKGNVSQRSGEREQMELKEAVFGESQVKTL
jgi:hypothetical protein